MKRSIVMFSIALFLFPAIQCFSQSFDPSKDDEISTFDTDYFGTTSHNEYGKHWLSILMDSSNLDDTIYLKSVMDFVLSQNSLLTEVYLDTTIRKTDWEYFISKGVNVNIIPPDNSNVGAIEVRLNDTMDAHNYMDVFISSGLFKYVEYHPVVRTQSYPLEEK